MSLASTQADIDAAMASKLATFATAQETFKFLNGRYWTGKSTHTNLPVDGSSASADLSSTVAQGEAKSWDDMLGTSWGSIPCALECRSYKKALYSVGHGYVVKLKFIYGGTVYERSQDSGYDSTQTRAWAASGTTSFDAPVVSSISPSSGSTAGGTSITITGTGFIVGGTTTVTINGNACTSVSVVSSTSITCTTPSGSAGAQDLVVTNTDSQSYTYTGGFTYTAAGIAIVQSVSATDSGSGGITLTLPSNVTVGNLLVLILSSNVGSTWSAPLGVGTMTEINSGKAGYQAFYKVATSTQKSVSSDDSGASKGEYQAGMFFEISGANASPIDATAATANSLTSPSVTTSVANCMVLTLGVGSNSDTFETIPTGFTQIGSRALSTQQTANAAYKMFASSGATGTFSWDAGTYSFSKVFTVSVKP